jgi:serine/threonine protein kinase/tetratricopeptide (TPR) repeat protein
MGKVYKVFDARIKEKIALKLIRPEISADKKTIERFSNELKFARKISHRNVCRMYDLGKVEGADYITMEFVPGEDLKSMVRMSKQLSIPTAISIAKQVCEGLSEAHRSGVVHRDLKPSNIMVDKDGNARIMDFGIARSLKTKGITGSGVMIGTPEYMSPEQVEGKEADQRSDIYSLGIILYEMVTGRVPFEGDTPFTIGMKHKSEAPQDPKELNAQIPEDLRHLIFRCLEKDKGERYQSAGEVQSDLDSIEKNIPTTDRVVPKSKPITSKEITVTFGLKKVLFPGLTIVVLLIAAILIWQFLLKKESASILPDKSSIAVLPFEDLSPQKDQEYFCDGMASSIINALSGINGLSVRARGSAFAFKDSRRDIKEIGEKLNVGTVLEGNVQKAGNKLRITAQLINVADESLLWSDQYNRELDDVFTIQDEITLAIVNKLKGRLFREEEADLLKRYTQNPRAYNLYMMGKFHWNKRTEEGFHEAINYFERATNEDPSYALAYVGLADSYGLLGAYSYLAPEESFPKAKLAVEKAIEIDDTLAEAHCSIALLKKFYEWDWDATEREYKRAIELKPGYATAHQWYAEHLGMMRRFDESEAEFKLAQEIDPLSLITNVDAGRMFYYARKYDQAIEQFKKTLAMDPNYLTAHNYLGCTYAQKGMKEDAIEEAHRINAITQDDSSSYIVWIVGVIYAILGERNKAEAAIDKLKMLSGTEYVSPYFVASIYACLGQKDSAFEWLERAYITHDIWLVELKVEPCFDGLRADPKFKDLMIRMNLE